MRTTTSNVDLELMPLEGESKEGYIGRIRDLQIAAAMKLIDAEQALTVARLVLAEARARDAGFPEFVEAYDAVMGLSRAVGTARYEKQSIEFALSEVFHTVNR